MTDELRAFGERLAQAALDRNWAGVCDLLAPWLQQSPEEVQKKLEDEYRSILQSNAIEEMHYPSVPYVSGNQSTLEFLREPKEGGRCRPIPAEVTPENFRQWMKIQLQCSEEQAEELEVDFLAELWLIVVELPAGLRVGYWATTAYEGIYG